MEVRKGRNRLDARNSDCIISHRVLPSFFVISPKSLRSVGNYIRTLIVCLSCVGLSLRLYSMHVSGSVCLLCGVHDPAQRSLCLLFYVR